MKSSTIIRNAALVLGFVVMSANAQAQTLSTSESNFLAVADVEQVDGRMMVEGSDRMEMVSRVSMAAANVKGVEADAQVREAIERKVMMATADAKVVRTVLSGDEWIVKVSELGVPKSEYRKGFVVYSVAGTNDVVTQQIAVERPFIATSSAPKYSVKLGPVK